MKNWHWVLLIVIVLLASFTILYKNYKEEVVGNSLDTLEIDNQDLKECCTYFEGEELKTCAILKEYDCNLCDSKCSSFSQT